METKSSLSVAIITGRAGLSIKQSVTVLVLVLMSMLYAVFCQAQIIGTGQLGTARRSHTATLLQDGKILIVGGDDANGLVGHAEIFDPATLTSSNVAANPIALRTDHTSTLLADGRVLIIGGVDGNGLLASSEFYNPYSVPAPSFTAGPTLMRARSGHTATMLSNGKIFIAGGDASGSAEIYDPATQSFSLVTGSLNTPRQYHSAALLNSGKVLIIGGVVGTNTTLTTAEVYDPQTQTFTPASGPMQTPRGLALLRVLPDGKVQIIGGDGEFSMEMFDPATNSFIALAHIPPHEDYLNNILASRTRSALITTIIQQNPVLQGQPELTAEIIALLNRLDHTVTEIPQSNRALIAGGVNDAGQILSTATVVSSSAATITTDRFDYAPGDIVTIAGQGWQPNETVWMLLHEEPETHDDVITSSVADNQGNFTNSDFAPTTADAGRSFTLTAIGQNSGFTTQTAFKDAPRIASVSVGAQTGPLTFGTLGSATYTVTPVRGNNGTVNGTLSVISGLPAGVTAGFSPNSGTWTANGGTAFPSFTLTLTTSTTTPAGTFTFTVRAADGADTATNTGTLTIGKAGSTTTVSCPANVTYTGSPLTPCSATVTGVGGLNQSLTVSYTNNTNAGTATASASFAGDTNHTSSSDSKNFTIDQAGSTTTVSCPANVTYTGSPLTPCSATVTGVGGLSQSLTVSYTNNTNAGTATASASFAGDTNHTSSSDSKNFTIDQAGSTTTVSCPANVTYTGSPLTPCSATVTGVGGLNQSLTVSYTNNTNTGTATASASFAGDANHTSSSDSKNFTIDKASSTTTVTVAGGESFTFDGNAHPATVLVTGAGGLSLTPAPVYSCGHVPIQVADSGCTASYTFAGDANHTGSSDSKTYTISKASSTTVVSVSDTTYDGASHGGTAAVSGVAGLNQTLTITYAGIMGTTYGPSTTAPINAGDYSASASFAGDANHNGSSDSKNFKINKAASVTTVTVTGGASFTYDGNAHPAAVTVTGAGGLSLTPAPVYSCGHAPIDVADSGCTASYTFAGDANHTGSSDSKTYTITKATSTTLVTVADATYDGNSHGGTAAVTGVGGLSQALTVYYAGTGSTVYPSSTVAPTNAGTYSASATFAGDANHNGSSDSKNFTINKAASITIVTVAGGESFTYDGNAHPATVSVTGAGGLSLTPAPVYSCGHAPIDVADSGCTASYTFAGDANHTGSSDSKTYSISKATPTVTVTGGTFTYDGNPHGATVTVTGIGGAPVAGSATLNYAGVPPTTSYGPSTTAPTDAGIYQVRSVFTSSDNNYNNAQSTGSITINKAASVTTVTVAGGESFTYDGNAHPATVSVTGAGGLNLTPAPVYSCGHAPIDVADSGCTASYTYVGDANHLGSSDSKTYTISKAAPIITVFGGTFTYDGASHGAATTVTGVGGAAVTGSTTLNYAGVPPISYGPSTTAPTNAGTYQARAVFTSSDGNYTNAQGMASVIITKADSTTTLSGTGSFIYDALAHAATANVTGAGGLNQSVAVNYSGNCVAAPVNVDETPCTVTATYAGDANHNGSSATGSIIIAKANASITVNGYTGVYDGFAHGASGSATGIGGVNLNASLNLGTTFVSVPGGTAFWTFTGGTNYNDAGSSVAIVITRADPIVTATGNTCTYNGSPCAGSGSATGVNGESLTPVNIAYRDGLGTLLIAAPSNAGIYQVAARYAGDTNYNQKQSAPATITINQASQAIMVTQEPPASAYFGQTFTVAATASSGLSVSINSSGSCSGSGNGSASITMNSGSGFCAITFDQSGDSNYQAAAQVSRNVTALNTAPVAQAQSLATNEDVPVDVTLSGSDIDNPGLTFSIVTPPAYGSLGSIGAPSCIASGIGATCTAIVTYNPAANFNGTDSFSFKVNDGSADSNIAIVSITVNPVNDAPTANDQTVTTNDATPLLINLTGSDFETAAANLKFTISALPLHGSLKDGATTLSMGSMLIGSPAAVTYMPDPTYKGSDSFAFTITDRGDPDGCTSAPCAPAKTSPEATVSISVTDATAPDAEITSKPASLSNDRNPTFEFTGSDNVTATGSLAYECKLDSGDYMPCTSPTTYTNLADGAHTFQVRAKDDSGNYTLMAASYTWTIDATPPDTVIDSGPSPLTNIATATFTFHSTENNSAFRCTLDGGAPISCGSPTTYNGLGDGQHIFTVAAVDQAGNIDPTPAAVTWTIDTLAPQTAINSGPSNPTTNTSATFTFSSSNVNDAHQCSLDGAAFTTCSTPKTHTGLGLGDHTFRVLATDAAGNTDATPASYSWTIGAVTLENYTMDSDFKRFDGFDVVFSRGTGSYLKINSTNPDSFHYQVKLTNNTGTPIGAAYGNTATAIITVPGMPNYCGGVPCSSQMGSLGDPAFVIKGKKVAHVWPGHHDRDDDDDDDDMPVAVKYMTLTQYNSNGGSCADNPMYSSTLPSNGAPKCIKITGFTIPVRHAARIRINFHFRLKGTDGWDANSQQLFYAGFVFRAATSVSFGSNVQTATDATGLVGAGKKATAIGGYAFNGATPGTGYKVRLFAKMSEASCTVDTKLVAQNLVDSNGFFYIWRSGQNQASSTAPSLPSGVQYAVQLCNGSTQLGLKPIDSKLREKEFEQIDFDY